MSRKNQSDRLTSQHIKSQGVVGIFGTDAKRHDMMVSEVSNSILEYFEDKYPTLVFRYRKSISKKEINKSLNNISVELGNTIFIEKSNIKPDGGIIEVKDKNGNWRVILVSEAKRQGKDIENIKNGKLVGKNKNQDLMSAGNAIERSLKNIDEIRNFMLSELHFPYVLFLEGSNFLTEKVEVIRPDGRVVEIEHDLGSLNRLDRLTSANHGRDLNMNLCENFIYNNNGFMNRLQSTSIYTQGNGEKWNGDDMFNIMAEITQTSLNILRDDL